MFTMLVLFLYTSHPHPHSHALLFTCVTNKVASENEVPNALLVYRFVHMYHRCKVLKYLQSSFYPIVKLSVTASR
jgi:hypothetical protein